MAKTKAEGDIASTDAGDKKQPVRSQVKKAKPLKAKSGGTEEKKTSAKTPANSAATEHRNPQSTAR